MTDAAHALTTSTALNTAVFSCVECSDRAPRDPRIDQQNNPMLFDGKRMIFGDSVPVTGPDAEGLNAQR